MRFLLDTQVFVLLTGKPEKMESIPTSVRELVSDPAHELCLSTITICELAIKYSLGKMPFSAQAVSVAAQDLALTILPYMAQHALRLYELPYYENHKTLLTGCLLPSLSPSAFRLWAATGSLPAMRGYRGSGS